MRAEDKTQIEASEPQAVGTKTEWCLMVNHQTSTHSTNITTEPKVQTIMAPFITDHWCSGSFWSKTFYCAVHVNIQNQDQ